MRLINADSIMRKMKDMLNESGNPLLAEKAIALIDHEPTAFDVNLAIEDIEDCIAMAEAEKKAENLKPLHQMLIILHQNMKDIKNIVWSDVIYRENEASKLIRGYAALEPYGWYFEPEEKMILDGTH